MQRLEKSEKVNHGANTGDRGVCFGLVSVGNVHVTFGTSGEIVGALSIDHDWIALG